MNSITPLLGYAFDSEEVQRCMNGFGEKPKVSDGDTRLYYSFPRHGVCLLFRNQHLGTLMFYSEGLDGFSQFTGSLPFDITFQDNREQVEHKVGMTAVLAGSVRVPFPGQSESNWIKFRLEAFALHIEFTSSACEAIRLVTVMAPKPSDRLN